MDNEKNLQQMYDSLVELQQNLHQQNQRRIRGGLKCLYIVPTIFLFLMFVSGRSKLVFLVFWIVSLFILAVYLLTVEYMDYTVQQKMNDMQGKKDAEFESLIELQPGVVKKRLNEKKELSDKEKGGKGE